MTGAGWIRKDLGCDSVLSMQPDWNELAAWWVGELEDDPAYTEEIEPLAIRLLEPLAGRSYLDVGCGEGRLMRAIADRGGRPAGLDLLQPLLVDAKSFGPVMRIELPEMSCVRSGVFDGVVVSLVLEHLEDAARAFFEIARVLRPGGILALVINHPIFTAPGSAPVQDPDEILWRPGFYFEPGFSDEPVGSGLVRFHHRSVGELLTAASAAGFDLERLEEFGVSDSQVRRTPVLAGQRHIPRLMGARWLRRDLIPT